MLENLVVVVSEIKSIACLYKKSRFYTECSEIHSALFFQLMQEHGLHHWNKMQFEYNDTILSCTVCRNAEDDFDTGFGLNLFLNKLETDKEERHSYDLTITAHPRYKMSAKRIGEHFRSLKNNPLVRVHYEDYDGRVSCGHYTEEYIVERKKDEQRKEANTSSI